MLAVKSKCETVFAEYTVVGLLGEGGAGYVFEVTDESGSSYALKILAPNRVTIERTKRFRNELAFCQQNVHPNIVRVMDYGFSIVNGIKIPFYVMPRYSGTLRSQLANGIAPPMAVEVYALILNAVEAAHLLGVWHRDIKPENILVGESARDLVVADFGIAHFAEELLYTAVKTSETARFGNFCYAAPEQRQRGATVDQRADIFSLGLILNELFTGEVPHGKKHRTIASVAPNYAYLDSLVDEMLHQSPNERPPSIGEIKKMLIGKGHEFVALQKLSELRNVVIPKYEPDVVPDIEFKEFDYKDGILSIVLNPPPPYGWMEHFVKPRRGHVAVYGYGPERFLLRGNVLSIDVPESSVEAVAKHARDYARNATAGLRDYLAKLAEQNEAHERRALAAAIREAEKRARVLERLSRPVQPG